MFKVYFLLEGEAFKYHGDEAAEYVRQAYPNVSGYVQTTLLDEQIPGRDPAGYAGTVEMWFRHAADALAAADAPLAMSDGSVKAVVAGHERVVMRLPDHLAEDRIKGVYPFRRKPGMSVEDFQHHWWHNHGPIAARTEEALYYVQTHVLPECYDSGTPDYDGVTELHYRDRDAAIRATFSRQMREDQGSDAVNFVDLASVELFLVKEDVIIDP